MDTVKQNLIAAMRYILTPLCRIAVRNGISFAELADVLRDATVSAARAELKAAGSGEPTVEDVGRITRMTTEQVARSAFKGFQEGVSGVQNYSWAASEVLAGWNSDPAYLGPYGLVLDVPFSAESGDGKAPQNQSHASSLLQRSFEELVRKYAGETVDPAVLLAELVKTKNVAGLGDGIYRCLTRTYIAEPLSPENVQQFAETVHNMIGTMAVNLKRTVPGTGLMDRTVFADFGLRDDDLPKFNAFIRQRGQIFADEVDNWLSDYSNVDRKGSIKTGIGIYHYVVSDEDREEYLKSLGDGAGNAK